VHFAKYQALGNDYLVLEEREFPELAPALVRRICDRHYGIGSDGILLLGTRRAGSAFPLRIYNPDGSEAEKSGNGLRICARYLFDRDEVGRDSFAIATASGDVSCRVETVDSICVEMGRVSFASRDIPVAGPEREVVDERIEVGGQDLRVTAASIGNPHCVVRGSPVDPERAQFLGPLLETHALFPRRTNVQLLEVLSSSAIRIEIWERGAGYTLASGSSSCAAAAAAIRLGLCRSPIEVQMPGGTLAIEVSPTYAVTMSGPAAPVASGAFASEWLLDPGERPARDQGTA